MSTERSESRQAAEASKKLQAVENWEKDAKRNPHAYKALRGEKDNLPVEYYLTGLKGDRNVFKINGEIFTIVSRDIGSAIRSALSYQHALPEGVEVMKIQQLRYSGLRSFRVLAGQQD